MKNRKNLHIAIVGSGTAGMAAAAFLAKSGHNVTIIERFSEPRPLGAGLLLQPTGLAVLASLGLDAQAIKYGAKILTLKGKAVNNSVIFDIDYRNLRPHFFGLGIHRGTLFSLLHDEVSRLNVKTVTGCDIAKSFVEKDKRILVDRDGSVCGAYDLVIDASGLRSALRAESPHVKLNKLYPYGAVWGVCEDADQEFCGYALQQRYDGAHTMIGALGIGKRMTDLKHTMAFFWSLPVDSYQKWREGGVDAWKAQVVRVWPEMEKFLAQFKTPDDLTFAQYSDVIMRRWDEERLVFIGDAAHCTSPQLGQGANLGMLDGLVLSRSLEEADDLRSGLAAYSKRRKNHVHFYQYASRWLTPFFQSDSRVAAIVRDRSFGLLCKTPYVKTEMLKTLAGTKTGLFTSLNPGTINKKYDLNR